MVMTPLVIAFGGLIAYFTVVLMVVVLPTTTFEPPPSPNNLPLTELQDYASPFLANGCVYCHSGFMRPQDVAAGQYYLYPRISEPGDYVAPDQSAQYVGSRNGQVRICRTAVDFIPTIGTLPIIRTRTV